MSTTVASQPMSITAGACAPGVPPQPTTIWNISFAAKPPPPAQTTLSNASASSAFTTTSVLTYTQTATVNAAQALLLAQAVGPACSSISTYAWPATLQQAVVELPAAPTTTTFSSAAARTVTLLPATVPADSAPAASATGKPDEDSSYGSGHLGAYQSAGVGVSCTVVFLAVVFLLFLLWRRRFSRRQRSRDDEERVRGKVELSADCECAKPVVVAELPAIELAKEPVELPAFETWTSGTLSELSSGEDEGSERGKSGSPLGDWLPTPI
jgi:hypothetical protein